MLPINTFAHSGRTDSNGGHNCNVGSCAGTYHYHNGGPPSTYSPPKQNYTTPTYKPLVSPKVSPYRAPSPTPQVLGTNVDDSSSSIWDWWWVFALGIWGGYSLLNRKNQ